MRKIKWGVIGTAGIARGAGIPAILLAENAEPYAIASRNLEKAEAWRDEFGFAKAYGSYEELLADPEVEAVYLPLPNTMHCEWAMKAAQAKKHILCEKPLAPSAEIAKKMIQTADENGVVLMEAFAYLHSPYMKAIKDELEKKTIGDVLYMESAFLYSDHDMSNIRMRKETLGGACYDLGVYNTSQILWMMGDEPDQIQAVSDFSNQGIDLFTTALFTYKDGRRASMNCGMTLMTGADHRLDHFQVFGTRGYIKADAQFNQSGQLSYEICVDGEKQIKVVDTPHNYKLEVEQLGRCITDGEQPHVSHAFTLKNAEIVDRILEKINY